MQQFSDLVSAFDSFVWGLPLIVILVGTGLFLTLRFTFVQFRGFKHGTEVIRGHYDDPDDPGEISHFRALTTALSATIGTGNIIGVSAAILLGGPGAVFWMWVTAFVGMASKFTCCTLSVHYRRIDKNGEVHGGPMHYIEMGMGPKYKWLAILFAAFTALASFGMGNMFQANNVATSVSALILGHDVNSPLLRLVIGIVMAVMVGLVIVGGVKRIAAVASKLVPAMVIVYFGAGMLILLLNMSAIPEAFGIIFHFAFNAPEAVAGGIMGGVIRQGVARGLFSNEAGLGSAAMAHGAAQTNEPVREGLVAMLGPFIDTIIVCTITALVIIITGAYETVADKGLLTSVAFNIGLPGFGKVVEFGVVLFAFSTLVSWSYYGDRAVDYLFGQKAVLPYRLIYVGFIVLGSMIKLGTVIDLCDAMNGLMAIPNLIALIVLSPVVAKLTKDYFTRMRLNK
jgi:alanine or glycine:cation symporter, AGCS family